MKIKKVDDKPLVIHTKQKAKLHTHEPKQASIKGSNIYTVDRDPTKKNKDNGDFRKSTVHQVQKEGLVSKYRKNVKESNQSIKVKNHSLRGVGMAGGKVMTDQMEGGQELQQASMMMYEASKPVTGTASRGADLFKRQVLEKQKLKIKKVNAGKKIGKKTAKNTVKKVVKKTGEKAAKETAKTVAKETSKTVAKTATTVATTAAGTAVAPGVGTAIGIVATEWMIGDIPMKHRYSRLDWTTEENKEKIAKIIAEIDAKAQGGFNLFNVIKAALSGEIKADAQGSLSNIVGSTLKNTLLTDYISAASGDSDVKKFGVGGVYAPANSIALYRMYSYSEEKKPTFRSDRYQFTVVMPNLNYGKENIGSGDDLKNDLKNDLETRLIDLIVNAPELTYKKIGEYLGVSEATVKRKLTKLKNEGKIIREGSNRKGKWNLKR